MRLLLTLLMDIIFLGLLIVGIVALWGLRGTNTEEDIPATVRVSKGQVSIVDPVQKTEQKGGGLLALQAGQTLRADPGSDAFVFYGDGSITRMKGPGELGLEKSQRSIRKPAILTRVRSKLFGKPPPPPAETKLAIKARLLRGEAITKTGASNPKNVLFEIRGPGVVVAPAAASFAVTVPEQGDVAVEVGQGQVAVGMLSLQGASVVPIVIPSLAAPKGILVPLIPPDKAKASDAAQMLEKVDAAVPALRAGSGQVASQGIDFRQVTNAEIPYFVGERLNGQALGAAPPVASRTVANTKVIEESVIVPSLASTTITDQTVAASIPAGFPGNPKVHFLPGSLVQVEYRGLTFVASLNVVDGRVEIQGLPFGIDPPQIEDSIQKALGTQELPALLSIVSKDGQATISYAKDIVATKTSTVTEETPVAESLAHNASYFRSIPTPRQISTDWKVVGSNALIAIVITFLASTLAGTASSFVQEHEARITHAYTPFVRAVKGAWGRISALGRILRWFSPGPFTRGVLMMFVFGAVYSFLAIGSGLLGPGGLAVLLTLSFTSGFMALYTPWVKTFIAKRMKVDAKVGIFPGQLGVALLTVGVSRAFAFKPGLMLGSPGGLKMPEERLPERQKFTLDVMSLVALAVLGAVTWAIVYFLPQIALQSWAVGFFKTARGFVSGLQDWSLAIFVVVVQGLFFGLLPRPKSFGWDLMKRNIIAWGIPFAAASFVFIHTQLNKQKAIVDLTPKMYTTLIVAAVLAGLAVAYRWHQKRKSVGPDTAKFNPSG